MNGEALGEGVVDAVLHKDAVGEDAGLAGLPVFRSDAALGRHLDIGVGFRLPSACHSLPISGSLLMLVDRGANQFSGVG